jgi:hypothetical protein
MSASGLRLAWLMVPTACGWMPEDRPITVYSSSGALCFTSNPDGSIELVVNIGTCVSSSCDRVLAATCDLSEAGGVITVTSHAEVEHGRIQCTTDCGVPTARCGSAPVAPGTYAVTYGLQHAEVTLPATRQKLFSDRAQSVTCP